MLEHLLRNLKAYIFEVIASWGLRDEPLKVRRVKSDAYIPIKGSCGSAGLNLYLTEEINIEPGKYELVPTGLVLSLPVGTYGRIAPRSGLSTKGIDVKVLQDPPVLHPLSDLLL